jgi:uncharacterized protein (TIGR03067 family)
MLSLEMMLMFSTAAVAGTAIGSEKTASANDVGHLRGTWTAVRAERDGRPDADIAGHVLLVEDGKFSIAENGITIYAGTLWLDEAATPWAIDFRHTGYAPAGKTWRGIYQIDGDTLTICDNAGNMQRSRPTSFATEADSGLVMVVFTRSSK